MCLDAKPLNRNEAKGDLVMIQTLLLFKCKLLCYHANWILVSTTTRSPSASLQIKGLATKYTTGRWPIMQKQSARIKCKNNLFKPASDSARSVKTTAYNQNNNIQYFHISKTQKSSKSGETVQGIVQSVSESLSMRWNRRLRGLTMFFLILA